MSAKETFLRIWDREVHTTVRVLQAFPVEHLEAKPHERSRSARDLAWQCAMDERVIGKILDGQNDLRNVPPPPPAPESMAEILSEYESAHRYAREKLSQLSDEEFGRTVTCQLPGGEWKMPQPDAFWGNLLDQVHHRGQLTVYLRFAGGRVPSIYGPSGDELPAR
ncbi:MAG TPA: DinB family protein [Candidatus Acidoferrales bacterium]|nr:DinB family protein [Candidatus Acidoferrales bacterium]